VEAIPAVIAVVDGDGTILDTNRAWRRFARMNGGTAMSTGRSANYLKVCDKVHGLNRQDAARFAAGIRAVAAGRKSLFSMEYACHSATEKRWFTGYVSPLGGKGDRRMVVAHVNITAAKLAEEKFRAVLESAPDAMVIVDQQGRIHLANRRAEEMFGYTRAELLTAKVEKLLPAAVRSAHVADRGDYAAEPSSRPMGAGLNLIARRKDGGEFPVEVSLSPLETESGLLVCSAIRDISERKKTEEAIQRLNAELEARVAARTSALLEANKSLQKAIEERRRLEDEIIEVSESERQRIAQDLHDDLGQQLAGIWCLSLAMEKKLEARSSPARAEAARIAGFLGKALALTRSLARGLHPVASEPGGLLTALHELAERSSELFKIRCSVACHKAVHIPDPTMATHLYRIAQEAVTNAVKHGHASRIQIALSRSLGKITLSVNDNGKGFRKPVPGHGGLGVRIMNYRAESLGGSLVFRARPRGGTSVVCTIPTAEDGFYQ
jgi:PAS domain S-box-containing protein